jgi:hypothetical protein
MTAGPPASADVKEERVRRVPAIRYQRRILR